MAALVSKKAQGVPLVDGTYIDVAGAIELTALAPDKASTFASNVTRFLPLIRAAWYRDLACIEDALNSREVRTARDGKVERGDRDVPAEAVGRG